jgi:phosphoribosyl-AMP cyclohydrolase
MVESTPASAPDFSHGDGLLPAIAQDAETGEVLMLAYMNAESYAETVATGRAVYYSRSRKRLWRKGEESGHVQEVRAVLIDCDADTILLKVNQIGGAACHEGYRSCFFREIAADGTRVVGQRVFDPAAVYGEGARGQGPGVRGKGEGNRETEEGNLDERPTGL